MTGDGGGLEVTLPAKKNSGIWMAHAHYDPLSFPGPNGNREGAGARGVGLRGRGVKQPFWVDLIVKVAFNGQRNRRGSSAARSSR